MKKLIALTVATLLTIPVANARVSCKQFATQAEAQAYFEANHAKALDRDHDGIACEHLAGGKKSSKKPRKTTRKSQPSVTTTKSPF